MADKLKEAREAAWVAYLKSWQGVNVRPSEWDFNAGFDAGHAHATADMAERVERLESWINSLTSAEWNNGALRIAWQPNAEFADHGCKLFDGNGAIGSYHKTPMDAVNSVIEAIEATEAECTHEKAERVGQSNLIRCVSCGKEFD